MINEKTDCGTEKRFFVCFCSDIANLKWGKRIYNFWVFRNNVNIKKETIVLANM